MRSEPRFVFDTNTLVAAGCFASSFGRRAYDAARSIGTLITCDVALTELLGVLGRAKFDRFVSARTRTKFLDEYRSKAEKVVIAGTLRACRDPTDDKFLELAVIGQAQFIVTRDNDLLVLDPFQGVRIMDAERLVALLAAPPATKL
jgi:uncharacterized protein